MNLYSCTLFSAVFAATSIVIPSCCYAGVEVDLVSSVASIQPGKPFTVALRMQHDPHWHTYWVNTGTGLPTSLTWQLPDGFKAGDIDWPVPKVFRNISDKVTGYGYEDENLLLVRITPPANLGPGTTVVLKAHADWLVCEDVCMPGSGDFSLTLPVSAASPLLDEKWAKKIAEFSSLLPVVLPPGWSAESVQKGAVVELHLKVGSGARPIASSLYFFSADGFIDYGQPQIVRMLPDGYLFRLIVADAAATKATHLVGVIRAENGWGVAGEVVGLTVDSGISVDVPLTVESGRRL